MNMKKSSKINMNYNKIDNNVGSNVIGGSPLDQPEVTLPHLDKMSVVVDFDDTKLFNVFATNMWDEIKGNEFGFIKENSCGKYVDCVKILCPNKAGHFGVDGPAVLMQMTSIKSAKPQVRLSFNPYKIFGSNLDVEHVNKVEEHLDDTFESIIGMTFFQFLAHSRVSYLEVWRHILDRRPDDYLFRASRFRSFQNIFRSVTGELQTIYFGKSSGNQIVVYNKAKEMDKNSLDDIVRIEARLRPKNMFFRELIDLPNPFERVTIYSLKNDNPPVSEGYWIAFQDACRYRTITKAIQRQPKNIQHALKKAVADFPVSWWQLDEFAWKKSWKSALSFSAMDLVPKNPPPLTHDHLLGDESS